MSLLSRAKKIAQKVADFVAPKKAPRIGLVVVANRKEADQFMQMASAQNDGEHAAVLAVPAEVYSDGVKSPNQIPMISFARLLALLPQSFKDKFCSPKPPQPPDEEIDHE